MAGIVALAAGYVLSQFYRSFLAVLTPVLQLELGATKADLSLASGAWFAAFALMQFIVGVALDRYGPRATASLLLGIAGGGGALLFAVAATPTMIVAAMALIGIGCSPILMAAFYVFAREFEPAKFATLGSFFIGVGLAGNVLGASPLAAAADAYGWRSVMVGLAAVTALCAACVYLWLANPPQEEGAQTGSGFAGFGDILRIRALWPMLPLMLVGYSVVAGIRGLWVGPYMGDVFAADTTAIGRVSFWMAIAMVAGTFIYGPLDRLFNTRKWVSVAGMAAVLLLLVSLASDPAGSQFRNAALVVLIGLFGTNFAVLMSHARASFPAHLTGRGVTLMNFFSIGGTGLMQWLTGRIASAGDGGAGTYTNLFAFYAAVLGAALAVYLLSRDAKPKAT